MATLWLIFQLTSIRPISSLFYIHQFKENVKLTFFAWRSEFFKNIKFLKVIKLCIKSRRFSVLKGNIVAY